MDNPWKKYPSLGDFLATPGPAAASSASVEPLAQMDPSGGCYLRAYVAQHPQSGACGMLQEFLCTNNSLAPSRSSSDVRKSFMSQPCPELPRDLQQLSIPKQVFTTGNFPMVCSSVMEGVAGNGALQWPTAQLSGNLGNGLRNTLDLCPFVSSRFMKSAKESSASILHNDHQAANSKLHSCGRAKVVSHQIVPGTKEVNEFSSQRELTACASLSSIGKNMHITASRKLPSEANCSVYNLSPAPSSGYLRVFCLATSGDLLLSNSGLLSVVCSCHHFHLSVAKFCEHSGLIAVNPGDVVHMGSGETIAQWRKIYFPMFGIRVPEDHRGWDWHEEFTPTTGLLKYNASMSNVTRSSNELHVLDSSGRVSWLEQTSFSASPRHFLAGQELVTAVTANEKLKETQGSSSNFILGGLVGTTVRNLHSVADNQLMGSPLAMCSAMSTLVGQDGQNWGCRTNSAHGDLVSQCGSSSMSYQTSRNVIQESNRKLVNNLKEKIVADKDALPSRIELNLGQPHQQDQMLEKSNLSVKPQLPVTLCGSCMLHIQQHLIPTHSRLTDCKKHFECPATSFNACARTKQNNCSFINQSFAANDAIGTNSLGQVKGDVVMGSVRPTLPSQLNAPSARKLQSHASQNIVSGSDKIINMATYCEGYTPKVDPVKFPAYQSDRIEKLVNINYPCLYNHTDKCSEVGCAEDGTCGLAGPNFGFDKQICGSNLFPKFVAKNGNHDHSERCEGNQYLQDLSAVPLDVNHCIAPFSYDHSLHPAGSSVITMGSSPSSCFLNEKSRLHALGNFSEFKQEHRVACLAVDPEWRKFCSSEFKTQGTINDLLAHEEQSHGPIPTEGHAVSAVATESYLSRRSSATCQMGLENLYKPSNWVRGSSLQSKEIEVTCQLPHESSLMQQPLLSCCQKVQAYPQDRCPCSIPAKLENHKSKRDSAFVGGQSGSSKIRSTMSCAAQWGDMPSKGGNLTRSGQPAELLGKEGVFGQAADTASRGSIQEAGLLKEKELSNISSGSSAPAVTCASIEINILGPSSVNDKNTRYENKGLYEGSEVDDCWSSDDILASGGTPEFVAVTGTKKFSLNSGQSSKSGTEPSCACMDKHKLRDSFKMKKIQVNIEVDVCETDQMQNFGGGSKTRKRESVVNPGMQDASFKASNFSLPHRKSSRRGSAAKSSDRSSNDYQLPRLSDKGRSHACSDSSVWPDCKRRRSMSTYAESPWLKNESDWLCDLREGEDDCQTEKLGCIADFCKGLQVKGSMKSEQGLTSYKTTEKLRVREQCSAHAGRSFKVNARNLTHTSSSQMVTVCNGLARPIACGRFGAISNGEVTSSLSKPAKIASLGQIYKTARRCTLAKENLNILSKNELKKVKFRASDKFFNENFKLKRQKGSATCNATVYNEVDSDCVMGENENTHCRVLEEQVNEQFLLERERDDRNKKDTCTLDSCFCKVKPKGEGKDFGPAKFPSAIIPKSALESNGRLEHTGDAKYQKGNFHKLDITNAIIEHQCKSSIMDSEAICCVCGISGSDDINCLLECSQCLIRVHQACYGIPKVPKSHWYCRPCRTSARDMVCVLCGYGGGAMTQALQSSNIVKSLLMAWNVLPESRQKKMISSENRKNELSKSRITRSGVESDATPMLKPLQQEPSPAAVWRLGLQKRFDSNCFSSSSMVHNSVTAGLLDSTVKQWVHVVCGLWTPGTRCPNVDTMSAFDVSGASYPRANETCSICRRPGGLCIDCKVPNCSVRFHPWCAHRKGLLQTEVEGIDKKSLGFYGRCLLHGVYSEYESDNDSNGTKMSVPEEKGSTCARTEGYGGHKWEGFQYNHLWQSNCTGGCLVPQEQINAWLHINGQKACAKGLSKLAITDVENDCRKEYARYKQAKGWKNLVVYKSGIHALGLYTSQFISRGGMVVEYIGEIVGLRVADRRELEYQSGRKLQYKSACYFFRIDKEHIIDATCKGGIARFVNHSCMPNCVAKVISIRNEKKVVFFADRDIYPGEEITYDYHFNCEEEGKKIPCFCNSDKCRRYLN